MYNGNVQQNPLCVEYRVTKELPIAPRFSPTIFYRDDSSVPLNSSRLYAQNPVFETVHGESVKVYLYNMYNGNDQQNPLCVESCVTKELPISPRFSPTVFYRDANSVLLRAHLCTAVGSMRRTPCLKLFMRRV